MYCSDTTTDSGPYSACKTSIVPSFCGHCGPISDIVSDTDRSATSNSHMLRKALKEHLIKGWIAVFDQFNDTV